MRGVRVKKCMILTAILAIAAGQAGVAEESARQAVANSIGMELLPIPSGSFRMGDPVRKLSESYSTVANVTITRPFLLGKTEVTQRQFKQVMGSEPWAGRQYTRYGDAYPAEWVNWRDAELFCERLTESEHKNGSLPANEIYRLPTEAEWEYACRAGTQTLLPFGDDYSLGDDYCWTWENTVGAGEPHTHEVGRKKPNAWGLHDMLGNVSEWCMDFWDPTIDGGADPLGHNKKAGPRAVRGGNWSGRGSVPPGTVRFLLSLPGARSLREPHVRGWGYGFRVARVVADRPARFRAHTRFQATRAIREAAKGAQSRVYLGISTADTDGGVVITAVDVDSPADVGGLLCGDVILSVQGRPIARASELNTVEGQLLRPYEWARFKVRRQGQKEVINVAPSGYQRLALQPIDSLVHFAVPGVPADRPAAPTNAVESLDAINVLTQVLFDRKTGAMEIVGHYDPRFPTGGIPYLDLLKTAIAYPQPRFSLEPDRVGMEAADRSLNSVTTPPISLEETTAGMIYAVVMGHSEAKLDRQRLLRAHAHEYGISPEDFVSLRNYLFLDADGGRVPPEIVAIQEAVLRNLGYEQAAQAWAAVAGSTDNDAATRALQLLHSQPGEDQGSLRVQALLALVDEVRPRTAGRWGGLVRDVGERAMEEEDLVVALLQALLPERDKAGKNNVYVDMFSTINLSEATYDLMVKNPMRGVKVSLVPTGLDPESQMHRIFYEADYSLKSIERLPELFRDAPQAPSLDAMWDLRIVKELRRCWKPRQVTMTVSGGKSEVSFGEVEMELEFEIHPPQETGGSGKDKAKADDVDAKLKDADSMVANYCRHVAAHYDSYAAVLPSFHEVREAAKIVALARWINAEKLPVRLDGVVQKKWRPPSAVFGLLDIRFTHQRIDGADDIVGISPAVCWSGGVSFAEKNWVAYESAPAAEPTMPSALTVSNQLGQQAAQAAVAGNLDSASHLAELSAQAMTGALTRNDLAKVNIRVERAVAMTATPAVVRLHKELSRKAYQQIRALEQNPAVAQSATAALKQINAIYDQVREQPANAATYMNSVAAIRVVGTQEPARVGKQADVAPVDIAWTTLDGGHFPMGSPEGEPGRKDSEDQAGVFVSRAFAVARTEITQRQFRTVMGKEPWKGQSFTRVGDNFPATWVSWFDATEFCERLTKREHESGRLPPNEVYRLPTEAEWEYACRAGEAAAYSFGDDASRLAEYAWFLANTLEKNEPFAHRVATRKANKWGLFDMHGNVVEWCSDWYLPELLGGADPRGPFEGGYRVARGGSWGSNPADCRSAARFSIAPAERNDYLGFRVTRSYFDE
jgi:formylglycine-generating enzyme required for sulfatase activity